MVAEASWSNDFAAANVLVESQEPVIKDSAWNGYNHWLGGQFDLDLGYLKKTSGVRIINTHNAW